MKLENRIIRNNKKDNRQKEKKLKYQEFFSSSDKIQFQPTF